MNNDGFEAVTVLRGGAAQGLDPGVRRKHRSTRRQGASRVGCGPATARSPKPFTLAGVGDYGVTDAVSLIGRQPAACSSAAIASG